MNADPAVMRWFPAPLDRARLRRDGGPDRGARTRSSATPPWAVEVLESERVPAPFVGFVGLVPPVRAAVRPCRPVRRGRLAAGAPTWWGLGHRDRGGRGVLRFAFLEAGLAEIVSFTVPANLRLAGGHAAHRHALRRHLRHPRAEPGAWWGPHVLYRATADDLPATDGPVR